MSTTATSTTYEEIRPFEDSEVSEVLKRVMHDDEFVDAIAMFKFGSLPFFLKRISRLFVGMYIKRKFKNIKSIDAFQQLVRPLVEDMVQKTTAGFTISGIENIDPEKSYLFVSNHRDIALDSAFLNYALALNNMATLRIAIGDNLLTKPYVSDLMRLNKSFIVNRSAKGPRQMLKASKLLSCYIRDSITEDRSSIWIAQREGRAKDGADVTEPAIIKMLSLSKINSDEALAETLSRLHIVPVAISYEYDPCDARKANELAIKAVGGSYAKAAQEDVESIGLGISGDKGRVHIAIGAELGGEFTSAAQVAQLIDMQIADLYSLHPSNFYAYEALYGETEALTKLAESRGWLVPGMSTQRALFEARIGGVPDASRSFMLAAYAECVRRKLAMGFIG